MELFDKRYLYVEWDDSLKDKEVAYGDEIYQIKSCIDSGLRGTVSDKTSNECAPFLIGCVGGVYTKCRFVYYDPLLEIKRMFNEGRKIMVYDSVTGAWKDLTVSHEFDVRLTYRIEEEAAEQRVTRAQLSEWVAKGNGVYRTAPGGMSFTIPGSVRIMPTTPLTWAWRCGDGRTRNGTSLRQDTASRRR